MIKPTIERKHMGGAQKLYFFPNGYGASVIKNIGSYGHEEDLWELGVIKGSPADWGLCYGTKITDDVLGWLSDEKVEEILIQIEGL